MRILVVEDEPLMRQLLRQGLQERDCAVLTAADGNTALQIAEAHEFDVILLDIGLPGRDGYDVVRMLRERARHTRVLMLTARDGEEDIIRGLDLGADGYMTKPFSFPELIARLQALTRPRREWREDGNPRIEAGGLALDLARRSAMRDSVNIELTRSEFSLLLSLLRSAERCVSRKTLMECVWGSESRVGPGALDVLVNSLRYKIDGPYRHKFIRTVRGSGYVLSCQSEPMNGACL
jgi:DNA-binding response OmpR family regulator